MIVDIMILGLFTTTFIIAGYNYYLSEHNQSIKYYNTSMTSEDDYLYYN